MNDCEKREKSLADVANVNNVNNKGIIWEKTADSLTTFVSIYWLVVRNEPWIQLLFPSSLLRIWLKFISNSLSLSLRVSVIMMISLLLTNEWQSKGEEESQSSRRFSYFFNRLNLEDSSEEVIGGGVLSELTSTSKPKEWMYTPSGKAHRGRLLINGIIFSLPILFEGEQLSSHRITFLYDALFSFGEVERGERLR